MGFWTVLFWIFIQVASYALTPKTLGARRAQPSGIGDFTLPTAEAGRCVPVLWGTCKVSGPNVTWYGDLGTENVKIEINAGWGGPKHAWVGYRYYLGQELALCAGPVDAVVDVLFDDKSVGTGLSYIEAGKNTLRIDDGTDTWATATIPAGSYASPSEKALAVEDAMKAAFDDDWRVVYGYHFVPDRGGDLVYAVEISGVATDHTVNIGGAFGNGHHCAMAIAGALNANEQWQSGGARAHFEMECDELGKFKIYMHALKPGVTGFFIRGIVNYDKSALPSIGFQMGADKYGDGDDSYVESDYVTHPRRYLFAFADTDGALDLDDAATTCGEEFGFGTGVKTIGSYRCEADRVGPSYIGSHQYTDYVRIAVHAPELYGGEQAEGGVSGAIDVHLGTATQGPNDYLTDVEANPIPSWPGICYAVFRHFYIGTQPYPKLPAFVLRRCPNQLGLAGGNHTINGDANPACMLYELLTDTRWGLGIDAALIDAAAFTAAGNTLATEQLGLSMLVDSQMSGTDLIGEILRHVDGVLHTDPAAGKITFALVRNDYDPEALLELNESNCTVKTFSRSAWAETRNVVKITYTDRAESYTTRVVEAQDSANIAARSGEVAVEEQTYRGLSSATNAQKVAARELAASSYPLARAEIDVNRAGWALRPGSVFRLTWAPLGIASLVCRVARIGLGTPEDGIITLDAVEDIFGVAWTAYTAPVPGGWVDPTLMPRRLVASRLEEAPYAVTGAEEIRVLAMAAPGNGPADGYEVWSDPTGWSNYAETADIKMFVPSAELSSALAITGDTITIDEGPWTDHLASVDATAYAAGMNVLLVDDEWIAWQTITDNGNGTLTLTTIARGCRDSTPAAHVAGARVWFETLGGGYTAAAAYGADLTLAAKLRPYSGTNLVPLAQCERQTCTTDVRTERPYVPCAVLLNGASYPSAVTGELTVSWSHRDRLGTWSYANSGATSAAETGTHYRVKIYGDGGTLKHTEDDIAGTSYTYPIATEMSENGGALNSTLRIVVETINASDQVSRQAYDWTVAGRTLGAIYPSAFVAYVEDTTYDTYLQKIDTYTGEKWSGAGVLVHDKAASGLPGVAYAYPDGTGGAFVGFQAKGASTYDRIMLAHVEADGTIDWTTEITDSSLDAYAKTVADVFSPGDGTCVVAWSDERNGSGDPRFYIQKCGAAGAIEWTANGIDLDTSDSGTTKNNICLFYQGDYLFASWRTEIVQRAQRIKYRTGTLGWNGGAPVEWTATADLPTDFKPWNRICTDGDDGIFVSATYSAGGVGVSRIDKTGTVLFTTLVGSSAYSACTRGIAEDGAGGAMVLFDYCTAAYPNQYCKGAVQRVSASGVNLLGSGGVILVEPPYQKLILAAGPLLRNGDRYVAFVWVNATPKQCYALCFDQDGEAVTLDQIGYATDTTYYCAAAMAAGVVRLASPTAGGCGVMVMDANGEMVNTVPIGAFTPTSCYWARCAVEQL